MGLPTKRMGHSAAMLGHAMVVYGGIYGEENRVIDDLALFDMHSKQWARLKLSKTSPSTIGPIAYHTMTAVNEKGIP